MSRPTFAYPFAVDYPVSSPFGPRSGGMHTGTDFAVPAGVEILASCDGTVIYVAEESGAGRTVTVQGADGWQSRYHHLQAWAVHQGQSVRAGECVGWCDSTGHSSGPHLHFEIRENASTPVDPIPILEADAGATPAPGPEVDLCDSEDAMLIIDRSNGKAAIIGPGSHGPRVVPSVNDVQRMGFAVLEHDAFEQYFADAIELFNAATR